MTTKEVKRTVYVSDGGREYENRKDCIGDEAASYGIRMWDGAGALTCDINDACVIEIATGDQIGIVQSWAESTNSIDKGGLYLYDIENGGYNWLPRSMFLAVANAVRAQTELGRGVCNG